MSTNETSILDPINYIIMPAIYQHFYKALVLTLLVAHHGDMQRVDGRTVARIGRHIPLTSPKDVEVAIFIEKSAQFSQTSLKTLKVAMFQEV